MPAEPAFIVPAVPGYRLQRRLGAWLLAGAALLLLASGGWSLWRVASAVDPQLQRLARTIERLRLNELGAEPGVFQATLAGEELQNLVGLGELVPFCLTVRNIHGLAVDQRCLGTAGAHPGGVESLLRATAGEEVGALLPLVRYPGTRVGELALAPHWPAQSALLWQHWWQTLVSAAGVLAVAALAYLAARRALRPTRAMLATLQRLEAGDLSARMPPAGPRELQRIGAQFNRMADRLQDTVGAQRQLADRLLSVREEERRHLARELHDELGQSLTSMRAEVAIVDEVARESVPALLPSADALTRTCEGMVTAVRHIVQQLRPPGLETFGLKASLEQLVDSWRRRDTGRCGYSLQIDGDVDRWDDTLSVSVFRLVQEGLTNAVRHGQATRIAVVLSERADGLHLQVQDNGPLAQPPSLPDSGGQGLLGMRERVQALGGTLALEVADPHGLRLRIHLPVHEGHHAAPADH
jgi:protein-histidine pros-kinase